MEERETPHEYHLKRQMVVETELTVQHERVANGVMAMIVNGSLDNVVSLKDLQEMVRPLPPEYPEQEETELVDRGVLEDVVARFIRADHGLLHYHLNKGVRATQKALDGRESGLRAMFMLMAGGDATESNQEK